VFWEKAMGKKEQTGFQVLSANQAHELKSKIDEHQAKQPKASPDWDKESLLADYQLALPKLDARGKLQPLYEMLDELNKVQKRNEGGLVEKRVIASLTGIISRYEESQRKAKTEADVSGAYKTAVEDAQKLMKDYPEPTTKTDRSFRNLYHKLANAIKKIFPILGEEQKLSLTRKSKEYQGKYQRMSQGIKDIGVKKDDVEVDKGPKP
jgi:hypothetical protein